MFNSFSRRRIVKVAIGFVAGIACIVQTQTIVQAQIIAIPASEVDLPLPFVIENGTYTIRSLGDIPGPPYLDGRTGNGTVGLAPGFAGGFTGARWSITRTGESCPGGPG